MRRALWLLKLSFLFISFALLCIGANFFLIIFILLRLHKIGCVQKAIRLTIGYSWQGFINMVEKLGFVRYNKIDTRLDGGGNLIIANHPSLTDVLFLIAAFKNVNCVAKKAIKRNPFLMFAFIGAGYIARDNYEEVLREAISKLNEGDNIIIFPEGTRTDGEIKFHQATSYIAIEAARNIVPFYIRQEPTVLTKHSKWTDIDRQVYYEFNRLDDIKVDNFETDKSNILRRRHLHKYLSELYKNYK